MSEIQQQGVMCSSLGMQSSSVPASGMASLSQTVRFTSSLPQTTMSSSIQSSQSLQQTRPYDRYNIPMLSMTSSQTETWQNQPFQSDPYISDQQQGSSSGHYDPLYFLG